MKSYGHNESTHSEQQQTQLLKDESTVLCPSFVSLNSRSFAEEIILGTVCSLFCNQFAAFV
jgi:hypothetical protein